MHTGKCTAILDTIVGIIETSGFSEVTRENVATQYGMSKPGLIYHSPSHGDMIRSIHEHTTQLWEKGLIEAAGGPAEEVSPANHLRANLQVSLGTTMRAGLLMSVDSAINPELREIWTCLLC